MSRKILIISTSPRAHSNSDALADAFTDGARAAGHDVQKLSLRGKQLAFCQGCLSCQKTGRCIINDDGVMLSQCMGSADVLVFATPVYYYGMSGQMKTLLDRANPLFGTDYAFREVYLLSTAADDDPSASEGTVTGLQGWISCFEKAHLAGSVFAGGVTAPGEIAGHPALRSAYDMGRAIPGGDC